MSPSGAGSPDDWEIAECAHGEVVQRLSTHDLCVADLRAREFEGPSALRIDHGKADEARPEGVAEREFEAVITVGRAEHTGEEDRPLSRGKAARRSRKHVGGAGAAAHTSEAEDALALSARRPSAVENSGIVQQQVRSQDVEGGTRCTRCRL